MEVTLPLDLGAQLEQELARGHYESADEFLAEAVRHFLSELRRGERRRDALRRVAQAVDEAGLYDRALVPEP